MLPSIESVGRRFAFLHRVLQGEFPCFNGTIKALRLSEANLAALLFLRLAVPQRSLVGFARRRTSAPPKPGVGNPVSPTGISLTRQQDLPSSWGTFIIRLPCSKPTPAGLFAPDHQVQQRGPWSSNGKGSHERSFDARVAWLSDSLSTLRSEGYPDTTQDSLPVAGQALLARDFHPQGSDERFQSCSLHLIPLSQAFLAQSMQPKGAY
jgi:hypothetical protein